MGFVNNFNGKGIIHGDIKLLLCVDRNVRLCNFAGVFLNEHAKEVFFVYTISWLLSYRVLHPGGSFTREDYGWHRYLRIVRLQES